MTVLIIDSDEPDAVAVALKQIADSVTDFPGASQMGAGTDWDYQTGLRTKDDKCFLASILHFDADGILIDPHADEDRVG